MARTRKSALRVSSKAAYHHGDLREHLVRAARQLVNKQGVAQFKLAGACQLAGVSSAAPYRHFADRDELLQAVVVAGFADLTKAAQVATAQFTPGTYESISAIGIAYVNFACREPNLFRLMFGRNHADEPIGKNTEQITRSGSSCYDVLLEHVTKFLGKPDIDDEVRESAFPLWTFVHGLSFILIDNNLGMGDQAPDIASLVAHNCRRLLIKKS